MIQIESAYIQKAQTATTPEDLFEPLQKAIELEHSTIPPYLTAMFSFKPNTGLAQQTIIRSVVLEEMLHMTIAANLLNALGGQPQIDTADFVPTYPGPLPMGVGNGLTVGLEAYSPDLIQHVFMAIEEPEHPLVFRSMALGAAEYHTIGEFYRAIQKKIDELVAWKMPGDPKRQITSVFPPDQLFPILTKEDAIRAIDVIVEQGEGTLLSPMDPQKEFAHYYRFQELAKGRKLIPNPHLPPNPTPDDYYVWSNEVIPFDPADVYPLFPNTKAAMLETGTEERVLIDNFNASYNSLLVGLHDVFNGNPDNLDNTIGVMFDIKLTAAKLCGRPFPGKPGYHIGPSFEFSNL